MLIKKFKKIDKLVLIAMATFILSACGPAGPYTKDTCLNDAYSQASFCTLGCPLIPKTQDEVIYANTCRNQCQQTKNSALQMCSSMR